MAENLFEAPFEALRQHVISTPGRVASVRAVLEGIAVLVANVRDAAGVADFTMALRSATQPLIAAIETTPPDYRSVAPVARVAREQVNHMGWPVAGTVGDPEPYEPAPIIVVPARELG